MPADDENDEPQPGDTVIELRDGAPFIYTQPAKGQSVAPSPEHREENDRQSGPRPPITLTKRDTPGSAALSGTRNERSGGPLAVSPRRGGQVKGSDTSRFYELLDELHHQVGQPRMLRNCTANSGWPAHGVYFFFEDGESRTAGQCRRVVRVGTTTRRTLWNRLAKHRGRQASEACTFALAAGPRRAHSVFRRHLGTAIIARYHPGWPPEVLDNWYHYRYQPLEEQIEREVSQYVGVMPFLWLDVPDRATRHDIEAGAISLLSRCSGGSDPPSPGWLGQHAFRTEIRDSGLWNVHHTYGHYDPHFMDLMADRVHAQR